ncbi:MAG: transposase [Clostridiales bacterium]|nr:transposase [Clostridiales bacterium]
MPRKAREKSDTGIYHVMMRGINKQTIFQDEEDNNKFLYQLGDCKKISEFELLAYCLMGNHVHLLIKEKKEGLPKIIKRIGTRYVYWYNNKYQRTGHLFQDRYKSEPVNDIAYLFTVLKYIHQNPVKAGLCKTVSEYRWSSYKDYLSLDGITDTGLGLSLFGENIRKSVEPFKKHMNEIDDACCLDISDSRKIFDAEAKAFIKTLCENENVNDFRDMGKEKYRKNIAILKEKGLSIRQISRLTGLSFAIVRKR